MSISMHTVAAAPAPSEAESLPETARKRGRDPFVDTLRVVAVALVVAQHWLMPVIGTDADGRLVADNALATPGAWAITWLTQVMPLIFFAGGAAASFSAGRSLRRSPVASSSAGRSWVTRRVVRLVAPVLPLAVIWVPLPYVLRAAGVPADAVDMGAQLVGGLLWFLALYTLLVAVTPFLLRWHEHWHGREIALLAGAAIVVDVVRFSTGLDWLGYVNLAFVWGAVYLVGMSYAEGRLDGLVGRRGWMLALVGFGVTALLVAAGPYAPSMVGMPGAPLSNMNPPTVVLLSLTVGQLGLALALHRRIVTWARLPEVSRGLAALSGRLMTIYVWHTPALVAMAGVAIVGFNWSTPTPFGADWRATMPIWVAGLTVVLAGAVKAFGRIEDLLVPTRSCRVPGGGTVSVAVALIGAGLLALTIGGFAPPPAGPGALSGPLVASLAIVLGTALLRNRRPTGSIPALTHERLST